MPPCTILLFATLQRVAGSSNVPWQPSSPQPTARQAWEFLCQQTPALQQFTPSLLVAINQQFASLESPIPPGAEIAFMPPVQGG
jgi:molybdopterin converting factor small subunit